MTVELVPRDVTNRDGETLSMSKTMSYQAAAALRDLRLSTMVFNLPLRRRPVVVLAEDECSYRVTELGVVEHFGLTIAR